MPNAHCVYGCMVIIITFRNLDKGKGLYGGGA